MVIIGPRPKGKAASMLMSLRGPTLVDRYRYDGLYVVDKVSVILTLGITFLYPCSSK